MVFAQGMLAKQCLHILLCCFLAGSTIGFTSLVELGGMWPARLRHLMGQGCTWSAPARSH